MRNNEAFPWGNHKLQGRGDKLAKGGAPGPPYRGADRDREAFICQFAARNTG